MIMILTESLNVPTDQQGSVSGNLTFISELVALALFGPIGALSDRVGRRSIMALGFVALGAGYMLYPLATSVEMLYLSRMVFAIGVASVAVMKDRLSCFCTPPVSICGPGTVYLRHLDKRVG